MKKSNKF